jgi:hypothetical protein
MDISISQESLKYGYTLMNVHASPLKTDFHGDASLGVFLDALEAHADKALVLAYDDGQRVQPGYHVTEVKAGSFVTLDCGGNPDAWQETVLQVEDIPASEGDMPMTVAKFRTILAKVGSRVPLDHGARLTWEVSKPGDPMKVYDVGSLDIDSDRVIAHLAPRSAICKPRHRAQQAGASACCG